MGNQQEHNITTLMTTTYIFTTMSILNLKQEIPAVLEPKGALPCS